MNDFEIQRGLRELNSLRAPHGDLWPQIALRLDSLAAAPSGPRRRGWLPLAAAAGVLLAVATAVVLHGSQHGDPAARSTASAIPVMTTEGTQGALRSMRDVRAARGNDPRMAGATAVLDAAHEELTEALERRPDAIFLVSLLNRTNSQRMKIELFGAYAG